MATPKLSGAIVAMAGWVVIEVAVARRLDGWDASLTAGTVLWFITAAMVLFINSADIANEPHFFGHSARRAFGWTALAGGIANLVVGPLWLELIALPILVTLGLLWAFAARDDQYAFVKQTADALLAFAGFATLYIVVTSLWYHRHTQDFAALGRQLVLPAWMTLGLLPFIYLVGLAAAYGSLFTRLNIAASDDRPVPLRNKVALVRRYHFRARRVGAFAVGVFPRDLAEATTWRAARAEIIKIEDDAARRRAEEQAEEDRLVQYAGVDGVDEDGLRLDRREFEDTCEALRWIATCMMGWHNRLGHYRDDMLSVIDNTFPMSSLPDPPEIALRVSADGQRWYAWRRTVTGWCFAIGASEAPPNQWEYDGSEPPEGFPGKDPTWGDAPFRFDSALNWC